jgi:hypothetical protein
VHVRAAAAGRASASGIGQLTVPSSSVAACRWRTSRS